MTTMKDEEEEFERDPFHLQSYPIEREYDDVIVVRAFEADLHDRQTDVRSITWRGTDANGHTIAVDTDEYDVVHLLQKLPEGETLIEREAHTHASPCSIDGMSELASDVEDTFFMEADEVHTYYAQKRQKEVAQMQRDRVEAKEQKEREERLAVDHDGNGDSSDVITQDQLDLMRRTAHALRNANNPSTLEMRILANHGGDHRFAFLRRSSSVHVSARLTRAWDMLRSGKEVTLAEANEDVEKRNVKALIAYESSDEEEDDDDGDDDTLKENERKRKVERAREWSRKRQARLQGEREGQKSDQVD